MVQVGAATLNALIDVLLGDLGSNCPAPYSSGPQLIAFFNQFGFCDRYDGAFPSRRRYTAEKLQQLNTSGRIAEVIVAAVDPRLFLRAGRDAQAAVGYLNAFLAYEDLELVPSGLGYTLRRLGQRTVDFELPFRASSPEMEDFIAQQLEKCDAKLRTADHDGAITNARSFLEAILLDLERQLVADPKPYDGDLPKLYKRVRKRMNLDETAYREMEPVMQLLRGLVTVIDGLSGVSNQMADRHAVTRRPARHHAELAVNAARTLASFMVSSFAYQRDRGTLGGAVQPSPGAAQDTADGGGRRPRPAFPEPI